MVDFANANLCGASPELNDVMSKLTAAKSDAKAKLNEAASTASAAFAEAQNELEGLKDKLQTIEIPTLPKLNLQAEIASLTSQIPGTPAFFSALAKIKTEFGDDIKSGGLELDSLVSSATAAILGGGNICALVPNLEKASGSTEPADQKPIAPKQAAAPAVTEASSVAKQVVAVEQRFADLQNKMSSFFTSAIAPTQDTSAFQIALPSAFKTVSLGGGAPTSVAFPPTSVGERTNYASSTQGDGFSYKKTTITETFSLADVVQKAAYTEVEPDGEGGVEDKVTDAKTYVKLKHKPVRIKSLLFHTGTGVNKGYWDRQERKRFNLDENIASTDANKGFYYRNRYGRHADLLISTGDYPTRGFNDNTNWTTIRNEFNFYPPVKLSDHPGNIESGGTVFSSDPDIFVGHNKNPMSDARLNSKYKGMCVLLTYSYLERYDPDYVPSKTPAKNNTPVPVSTLDYPTPPTAQPTVATVKPPPTKAVPEPARPAPAPKKTPPEEIAKIKSASDRKSTTTLADLQKIADAKYSSYKVEVQKSDEADSGQKVVYVTMASISRFINPQMAIYLKIPPPAKIGYAAYGQSSEQAFEEAVAKMLRAAKK
jgi:hypothetical protein